MGRDGLEIERKYLLAAAPPGAVLASLGAVPTRIEQVYLLPSGEAEARRVRRLDDAHGTHLVYTEKRQIRGIVRHEREVGIDDPTYRRLLAEADPARHPIVKTRHRFPYRGRTLELDVFEGRLAGLVLLEAELDDEEAVPEIPPELGPCTDVSEDPAYLNWNLALR
jgi:adenylate cyclase